MAIYIYYSIEMEEWSPNGPTPISSPLIYNPRRRWEMWRFLTYQFIHIGLYHILFNTLMQLILGIPLEMVHKWYRVGIVYSVGVIAGSLGSSLSDPATFLAGASGGVYALIAAHLATVVLVSGALPLSRRTAFHMTDSGPMHLSDIALHSSRDLPISDRPQRFLPCRTTLRWTLAGCACSS